MIPYYKELAHMTVEAAKSQDLQSASWSPGRASGVVLGLRLRETQCFGSGPKAGKN